MKLNMKKALGFSFAALMLSGLTIPASAAVIFSETFADNSNGWTENANWDVTGGVYEFTNPTDFFAPKSSHIASGLLTAADFASGSYTISYDLKFLAPWVGFNMGASWRNSLGNHNWSTLSKEYSSAAFRARPSLQFSQLEAVGGAAGPFSSNTWYHVDINIDSNSVAYLVDNVSIGTPGFVTTYDMDYLGFSVWRANAEFDNLMVVSNEEVPEPTTLALLGLGLVGMGYRRRLGFGGARVPGRTFGEVR